jgi:hypothetical protein
LHLAIFSSLRKERPFSPVQLDHLTVPTHPLTV